MTACVIDCVSQVKLVDSVVGVLFSVTHAKKLYCVVTDVRGSVANTENELQSMARHCVAQVVASASRAWPTASGVVNFMGW